MNPLDQLRDIHLSEEIGQWPPAYGWWILAVLVIVMSAMLVVYVLRQRSRSLAKRQALLQLALIDSNQQDWPQQVNALLKRLAISYFDPEQVATLHSDGWIAFLTAQLPDKKRNAFVPTIQTLQSVLYQPGVHELNFADVTQQVSIWIRSVKPAGAVNTGKEGTHV